jgi:hypothetical protein
MIRVGPIVSCGKIGRREGEVDAMGSDRVREEPRRSSATACYPKPAAVREGG